MYEARGVEPDPNCDTYLVPEGLTICIQGPGFAVQLAVPERKAPAVKFDVQSGKFA